MEWNEKEKAKNVAIVKACGNIANNIGDKGCRLISEALQKNTTLVKMNLLGGEEDKRTKDL